MEERRAPVRRRARALSAAGAALGAALAAFAPAAPGCELPPGERLESPRYALSYRTEPARITVGEPFTLELSLCPKAGAAAPGRLRLDAHMPEHRHGMNYRPGVTPAGGGRYRSEGWLFHMPGRWEFVFELGSERLTHSVRVE